MAKEVKTIAEIQDLILAELRAQPNTAGVKSIIVTRHGVDSEGANWGSTYRLLPGTARRGDCEAALRDIIRRLRAMYDAAPGN